jgi:Flp pilus assembly pilin Flp
MMYALLRRLRQSRAGATVIEFAIVCPVFLVLVMGLGELAFQEYLQSVLTGAVQKAARDSTIDGNGTVEANTAIDNKVKAVISGIIRNPSWDASSRENYSHFADIGPEYFFDSNGNNTYDKGECFIDTNGNALWEVEQTQ